MTLAAIVVDVQNDFTEGGSLAVAGGGRRVDAVELMGIATDHCVAATALDAAREGFAVTVRLDLTAGVAAATTEAALGRMRVAGITLTGVPVVPVVPS